MERGVDGLTRGLLECSDERTGSSFRPDPRVDEASSIQASRRDPWTLPPFLRRVGKILYMPLVSQDHLQ